MAMSMETIYRDAADFRISWQEALQWTLVVDEDGEICHPMTEEQKIAFHHKARLLQQYSKTVDDVFLTETMQKLMPALA